ncbi:hypothetical protein Tco_0516213 [Tanacetum coccineum]
MTGAMIFDEPVNYALMAISSSSLSSSSDNEVRSSDEEITPANDRFSKADGCHTIPPPITGNFLTPRDDISFVGLDEYAIRKKIIESKINELKTDTSKSKTSETVVCERQDKWKCVLTRLIDDLLALDSKVRFDISDRRLELTATFSIPTYSEVGLVLSNGTSNDIFSPEQTATAAVVSKSVAGSSFPAASSPLLTFDVQSSTRLLMFGSKAMKTNLFDTRSAQCSMLIIISLLKVYVVPTSRLVVPTSRYVVPAGKVIIIVSLGRLSLVPTGRILSPGSKDLSKVGSNIKLESLGNKSLRLNDQRIVGDVWTDFRQKRMSAKGEKNSGEQSSIYRQSWKCFGLADPLSFMAGPLITKGAAQAQTLPFLSFLGEVFSGTFLAVLR